MYHEKLTQKDVKRLQEEIDHRKLVVRKEAIEALRTVIVTAAVYRGLASGLRAMR